MKAVSNFCVYFTTSKTKWFTLTTSQFKAFCPFCQSKMLATLILVRSPLPTSNQQRDVWVRNTWLFQACPLAFPWTTVDWANHTTVPVNTFLVQLLTEPIIWQFRLTLSLQTNSKRHGLSLIPPSPEPVLAHPRGYSFVQAFCNLDTASVLRWISEPLFHSKEY